jgi:lipoprotein-anchoring transpeptidase ErfK/SrfK
MRKLSRLLVALALACVLFVLAGCTGSDQRPSLSDRKSPPSGEASVATTAASAAALPPGGSYIAKARVPLVKVYESPEGVVQTHEFPNPWFVNDDMRYPVDTVFLVDRRRGDWLKVLLPVRPNNSTGWVRTSDVMLVANPYRIEVDLSDYELRLFKSDDVVMTDVVAIGAPGTPTPVGRFFIRVLLKAPDPNTVYGPYAYGLSSHSETLTEFNGGDAEVGIHGNNDASALGQAVSHGCIRMDNTKITELVSILPLGTPVEVQA